MCGVLLFRLCSWDTKLTTMLASAGGASSLVGAALQRIPASAARVAKLAAFLTEVDEESSSYLSEEEADAQRAASERTAAALLATAPSTTLLDVFAAVVEREWSRVFDASNPLPGEELPFALPAIDAHIPDLLLPFPSCTDEEASCQCTATAPSDVGSWGATSAPTERRVADDLAQGIALD